MRGGPDCVRETHQAGTPAALPILPTLQPAAAGACPPRGGPPQALRQPQPASGGGSRGGRPPAPAAIACSDGALASRRFRAVPADAIACRAGGLVSLAASTTAARLCLRCSRAPAAVLRPPLPAGRDGALRRRGPAVCAAHARGALGWPTHMPRLDCSECAARSFPCSDDNILMQPLL
jgi:hypothetical protein